MCDSCIAHKHTHASLGYTIFCIFFLLYLGSRFENDAVKMIRKLAIGSMAAIPVVSAAAAAPAPKDDQATTVKKYKAQDLPIYTTIYDDEPKR